MHYSNGRAAKAGDLVRGDDYNSKHEIFDDYGWFNFSRQLRSAVTSWRPRDSQVRACRPRSHPHRRTERLTHA
jgi:hypothetical protein